MPMDNAQWEDLSLLRELQELDALHKRPSKALIGKETGTTEEFKERESERKNGIEQRKFALKVHNITVGNNENEILGKYRGLLLLIKKEQAPPARRV